MPLSPFAQKLTLDWVTGAAAATRPTARWIGFATQSPTSQSAHEGQANTRATVTFAAANSPQGTVTNLNAFSNISALATVTFVGWNLWDAGAAGNRLAFGTCTAAIGCKTTDNVVISAGGIKIVLT
jgi:hypothetical protein